MATDQWFVVQDGQQKDRPYTSNQILEMMTAHPRASFMVWQEGMAEWAEPSTLDAFQQAVGGDPPPAPPAGDPKPAPGGGDPDAVTKIKKGGKQILKGAAHEYEKIKNAKDAYGYLPYLKLIDVVLDSAKKQLSVDRLDKLDEWSQKIGLLGSALIAVLIFLFGVLLGIKTEELSTVLEFALIFPIMIIAQYTAFKFLGVGRDLIGKAPSQLSSRAFFQCFALLLLIAAILAFGLGVVTTIQAKQIMSLVLGLGFALVYLYMMGATLNHEAVNVQIADDDASGVEAVGILAFLTKLGLRAVPFFFGTANLLGLVMILYYTIQLLGMDQMEASMFGALVARPTFILIVGITFLPFLAYVVFLLYYLTIDLLRAILSLLKN